MGLNWRDVGQAISDLQLQIVVILGTLIILICFTVIFGVISKRLNRSSDSTSQSKRLKSVVGLRLRMRHGAWQAAQPAPQTSSWWGDFWQGISTEFFGAVVTTIFLGLGVLVFDQYQDIQNRKQDLILQMGSPDNATAIEAVRQLRAEGWLEDSTLRRVNLGNAKLQEADLGVANLEGAYLRGADLQGAYLWDANLQGADLFGADLKMAYLSDANLQRADLRNVDLSAASLEGANLQGADLRIAHLWVTSLEGANLQGAFLEGANLLEEVDLLGATLPDGSRWTPETDMTRFTDPNHPNFWNPCTEINPSPRYCQY